MERNSNPAPEGRPFHGQTSLRPATAADIPAMSRLLDEVMTEHGASPLTEEERRDSLRTALARPDHGFLVAQAGTRIVGMCALIVSFSTWRNAPVCEVQDVVVTREHRGKGLGRLLLERAAKESREMGCSHLFWLAESWNLPAHAFYRSLGAREKAVLYFERDLSAGGEADPRGTGVD